MELRRRQWVNDVPPVSFPAWRRWEDRRVRADDNVLALFAAARIAKASIRGRGETDGSALVSDLYSDDELEFREAFRVTQEDALARFQGGVEDLARMAIVNLVAATDDLLGGCIRLLRATGNDGSQPDATSTGVGEKIGHLAGPRGLDLDAETVALYGLLVEVRHAVTHYGGAQAPVVKAWKRLAPETRDWWSSTAGRPMPTTVATAELRFDDREFLAALKALDRVCLDVSSAMRRAVEIENWAQLVAAEYRAINLAKANGYEGNLRVVRHASKVWRIGLTADEATGGLENAGDVDVEAVLRA